MQLPQDRPLLMRWLMTGVQIVVIFHSPFIQNMQVGLHLIAPMHKKYVYFEKYACTNCSGLGYKHKRKLTFRLWAHYKVKSILINILVVIVVIGLLQLIVTAVKVSKITLRLAHEQCRHCVFSEDHTNSGAEWQRKYARVWQKQNRPVISHRAAFFRMGLREEF